MPSLFPHRALGQDIPATTEQQLENTAEVELIEREDDSDIHQREYFKRHPLKLNEVDANQLKELMFLTDLQIHNLISYPNLLGKFISIYELQAVPAWDISTIKKALPYVTIGNATTAIVGLRRRFKNGDHGLLVRFSQIVEKAKGFDKLTPGTKYLGGAQRVFLRYRYRYKNLLQFGLSADKDAGEQFFKGSQHYGFDFYSFHFF